MSSKTTIMSLNCCHIYDDYIGGNGKETLCISVDYDFIDGDDFIEVESESDFAILMRYLLKDKTEAELKKAIEEGRK